MENIYWQNESIKINQDIIYSIVPVFKESMIVIIVKDITNNSKFEVFINNKWYCSELIQPNVAYNYTVVHKCKVPFDVFIKLKKEKKIGIKIRIPNTQHIVSETILYNKIMDSKENYLLIESVNHIFFRKETIKETIINIIPWIEYHLSIGVDQILINQSQYLTNKNKGSEKLWIDLLYPYLKSNKVFLIMYKDNIQEYSHQTPISNIAFYLSKHRTKWFATHDLDEYICKLDGSWDLNDKKPLQSYLNNIPDYINYIETKMYKVLIPKNKMYISSSTLASVNPMPCFHKCIAKADDINIIWVHYISSWKDKVHEDSKYTLRINHYKPQNEKDIDLINYNKLDPLYKITLNNINKKYNLKYTLIINNILKYITSKSNDMISCNNGPVGVGG